MDAYIIKIFILYQLYRNCQIIYIGLRGSAKLVTCNYSLNVYLGNSCTGNKLKLHFLHILWSFIHEFVND